MKDQVYQVDENGFLVEIYVVDFNEDGTPVKELEANIVSVRPPDGLYRARWTGIEWVEDKTTQEFEEEEAISNLNPSQEDIEKAEFDLKVITTLLEVELI